MIEQKNNSITYSYMQCQQCGICKSVCPKNAISFKMTNNGLHEVIIDNEKCILCKKCISSCPANKIDDYTNYFNDFQNKNYFLGYNSDNSIRHKSSSGGVCKTLIIEGLKNGIIDGVYSLKKTDIYPYAEGEFYSNGNLPDYDDIPNSIYHSVMACTNVHKIPKCDKLMIVGTACQLKALDKTVKNKCNKLIKVCIFCKQQKTLDSTKFIAKMMGVHIDENQKFQVQYRGNGWPGLVIINKKELPYGRASQLPFGRRLWTVPGCDICGDSYGIIAGADLSLMDPWVIKDKNNFGETLITVHTSKGYELLKNIPNLVLKEKTYKEVKPALSIKDILRKQQLTTFFKGTETKAALIKAGKAELKQKRLLQKVVEALPRMPIICYRIICKLPDLRNKILK